MRLRVYQIFEGSYEYSNFEKAEFGPSIARESQYLESCLLWVPLFFVLIFVLSLLRKICAKHAAPWASRLVFQKIEFSSRKEILSSSLQLVWLRSMLNKVNGKLNIQYKRTKVMYYKAESVPPYRQ